MKAAALTVLMPVFNACEFLPQSIESILTQSFGDFEFLIIDDGSTDGSAAVLAEYARQDRRIRVLHQENRGIVATLSRGVAETGTPLVARMDADDVSLPDRLYRQVQAMDDCPQMAVLGAAIRVTDSAYRPIRDYNFETDPNIIREKLVKLEHYWMVAHPAVMMRTQAIRKLGGYRPQFLHVEDYDLWLRASEQYHVANLPQVLLEHRTSAQSISGQHHRQQKLGVIAAMHCALLRRRGYADPSENLDRPVDEAFVEALSEINGPALWFDRLKMFVYNFASYAEEDMAIIRTLIDRLCATEAPPDDLEKFVERCPLSSAEITAALDSVAAKRSGVISLG